MPYSTFIHHRAVLVLFVCVVVSMNSLFGSSEPQEGVSGPAMAAFLEMERTVDVFSRSNLHAHRVRNAVTGMQGGRWVWAREDGITCLNRADFVALNKGEEGLL